MKSVVKEPNDNQHKGYLLTCLPYRMNQWYGARGRTRTGTANWPADFTYPLQLSLPRRVRGDLGSGLSLCPIPLNKRVRRQGPSSLYTFPVPETRRGLSSGLPSA